MRANEQTNVEWPMPARELRPGLELSLAITNADMGALLLRDRRSKMLRPVVGVGLNDDDCTVLVEHPQARGVFEAVLSERRRLTIADAWLGASVSGFARRLGFRGLEVLPLHERRGEGLGAIALMFRRRREPDSRVASLVDHSAKLVVSALSHANARVAAEQMTRRSADGVAMMSHELRTPLQSIAGYIGLLQLDEANARSDARTKMLERLEASGRMLARSIEDLITFARLEAGRFAYELGPVLAHEAVARAEAVVAPLAAERGVSLDTSACPSDFSVRADAEKLMHVLVNLLANAARFSGRGGTVRVKCGLADRTFVEFRVIDTGPGIPPDRLDDVFEPYVQLTDRSHGGGSGLGLTISREFARGMGGRLSVESVVGSGSTFILRLPRAQVVRLVGSTKRPPQKVRERAR